MNNMNPTTEKIWGKPIIRLTLAATLAVVLSPVAFAIPKEDTRTLFFSDNTNTVLVGEREVDCYGHVTMTGKATPYRQVVVNDKCSYDDPNPCDGSSCVFGLQNEGKVPSFGNWTAPTRAVLTHKIFMGKHLPQPALSKSRNSLRTIRQLSLRS